MFSKDDLTIITDPVGFIRNRPDLFLPEGRVSGEILALRLISDILIQPYRLAMALRADEWWVVASNEDWMLCSSNATHRDPFTHVIAFVEAGPNSLHTEILITAYCKDVITFAGMRERKVKGERDDNLLKEVRKHPEWCRCVAFRL